MRRTFLTKFVAYIIIYAFLSLDSCWALGNILQPDNSNYSCQNLSPAIQINNIGLNLAFNNLELSSQPIKDINLQLYNIRQKNVAIEVVLTKSGYRLNIKALNAKPVVLHWAVNDWKKPDKELWPQSEHVRTYFHEKTKAMRTQVEPSAEGEYVFSIDIPQEMIPQINKLVFVLFEPESGEYLKADAKKDFSVPISNVLETAVEQARKPEFAMADSHKGDLIDLIQASFEQTLSKADKSLEGIPIFYDARENIISQVTKVKDGLKVDFWIVSDEKLVLHWGVNGWQRPPRKIWPDRFINKTSYAKKSKAVQTQMHNVSEDGLYHAAIYIPQKQLSKINNLNYNVVYPKNGYWDNNNEQDYNLNLQPGDMLMSLMNLFKTDILYKVDHTQDRELLKNQAMSMADQMDYADLLHLFKSLRETEYLEQEDDRQNILGLVLIAKLLNEGAVWDSARKKIVISKEKTIEAVRELVDKLDPMLISRALYLFGMLDASWISRLVHGLDYKQIHEDTASGKIPDLTAFLQQFIDSYDDQEGAPRVLAANSVSSERIFLTLQFGDSIISSIVGYPTKDEYCFYQGQIVQVKEIWGNEFSPVGRKISRYVDTAAVKDEILRGHEKGIKFVVDLIPWQSMDFITKDNYMYFHHRVIEGDVDAQKLLMEQDNFAHILHLPGNKHVLIYNRSDSADQPKPDLTPNTKSGDYWKGYYIDYLKHFIDEYDVDAFRVDLPGELQEHGDYSVFKSACFEAIEHAASKGKKIFFLLEAYGDMQWAEFSGWNHDKVISKYGYEPFRCYYKPIMDNIEQGNAGGLKTVLEWVVKRVQILLISMTNFDEKHAQDIVSDKATQRRYADLWSCFVRAGFDNLVYLRDMGLGDIVPVVGGDRIAWGGGIKYYTHKFAGNSHFRNRIEKSTGELVERSDIYQVFKNASGQRFSQVFFRGNRIIFYRPGQAPKVFDLNKIARPMGPIPIMDMEDDINIWMQEHVYSIPGVRENNAKALEIVEGLLSAAPNMAMGRQGVFEATLRKGSVFVEWDWQNKRPEKSLNESSKVLTVHNHEPFVVELKKKGEDTVRRIPSMYIPSSKTYTAMIFGLEQGEYEISFLWALKHDNEGWEGFSYHFEVFKDARAEEEARKKNLKAPFLWDRVPPAISPVHELSGKKISEENNRRNKLFMVQMPVFSCRQKEGQEKGIGKWTDYSRTYKRYHQATGANAFLTLPIHPTFDTAYSSYTPMSNYALNELFNDWDDVIDKYFPQLADKKPDYFPQTGSVDYAQVKEREEKISRLAFNEFMSQSKEGNVLWQEFTRFRQEFSWWLDDYCDFRVLNDFLDNKPWWEWKAEDVAAAKKKREYEKQLVYHAFSQFIALRQWKQAIAEIHAMGGKVVYDKPYFCAKNSVEVWKSFIDNKGYFMDLDKSPGVLSHNEKLIWGVLALYNYTNLKKESRPYDLVLKDHEYKLDVLGFDGGRIDAGHMAYPWSAEDLRSGDEPGDEFLFAIRNVFDERHNPLLIIEQLGASGDVMDRIAELGFITMKQLIWHPEPRGNVMVSLNSHDEARIGERYGDPSEDGYKRQFGFLFYTGAPIVCLTAGDEVGDHHRINNPQLKTQKERIQNNWKYRLPHPADQDYRDRVKFDLTGYIRDLSMPYLGDWDRLFYQGVIKGRAAMTAEVTEQMAADIENKGVDFGLKSVQGQGATVSLREKKKDIFRRLYETVARDPQGNGMINHHAWEKKDFLSFAEFILGSVPGLEKENNQILWEEFERLKTEIEADPWHYLKIAHNVEMLGFLSGVMDKIEDMEQIRQLQQEIGVDGEIEIYQSI